jgi:hypothetical protein
MTIDHTTFSIFRTRFKKELKALNRQVSKLICSCHEKALLELVIDGTRIRANSDRYGARSAEFLERLIASCTQELEVRLARLEETDEQESEAARQLETMNAEIERLNQELEKYKKALAVARERDEKKRQIFGKNATPVRVPVTDPDSQITPNKEGGFAPNYLPCVAVDAATRHIIFEEVLVDSNENAAVEPAVEQAREMGGNYPERLSADSGFADAKNLQQLDELGIEAYMPTNTNFSERNPANRPDPTQPVEQERIKDLPRKNKKFSNAAFIYDEQKDIYYCPTGQALRPVGRKHKTYQRTGVTYRTYQCPGCAGCPLANDCVKENTKKRKLQRDEYQGYREKVGRRMATAEGKSVYKRRAPIVEGAFAIIKHIMGIRRFWLRGLEKVQIEWSWVAGAFNLKRLLRLITMNQEEGTGGKPRRKGKNNTGDNGQGVLFDDSGAVIVYLAHKRRLFAVSSDTIANRCDTNSYLRAA